MFTAVAVADMNKDGLKDIITCDYNDNEYLYIQNTTGNLWSDYSSTVTAPRSLGIAVGDVNNDSHMDILYGCHSGGNGVRCLLGNSGGVSGTSFTWTAANTGLPTADRYYGLNLCDIDLDGDLDLVAASSSGNDGMEIYLGNGTTLPGMNMGWTLALNTNLTTTGNWFSTDCADINNDGSYDIVACGWGGGVKAWLNNISLDVTAPGDIIDLTVEDVTMNSIKVNWTVPADNGTDILSGPVKNYDIRYSTSNIDVGNWNTATQCTGEPVPTAPDTVQNFTITGLSQGTLYYIRMRCSDERPNFSPLSNIASATTLGLPDTTLPGKITDLQAFNPTNNSVNLTWTAPSDNMSDIGSGPAAGYEIRYNTIQVLNATWNSAAQFITSITPAAPGSTELLTVTGLQADTTYYFAVKAVDELSNWGWISNSPFNKTLPDPDITSPAAITDLAAIEPTNNTINLTWTAVGDDDDIGTASYYDIRYAGSQITTANWAAAIQCPNPPVPQSTGNKEYYQVTGLSPATTYYFAVKVGDETPTWSGLSNIATNTTLQSLIDDISPDDITDLSAHNPSLSTITLMWTAPGDDRDIGNASEYDIGYSKAMITDLNWDLVNKVASPPVPKPGGQTEIFVVTGLEQNTTYYFAIKTADEIPNWSPLSNVASEKTLGITQPSLVIKATPQKTVVNSSESFGVIIITSSQLDLQPVTQVEVRLSSTQTGVDITPSSGESGIGGIFSVTITAPTVTNKTEITIDIEASKMGYNNNKTNFTFTVNPVLKENKFNLHIINDDITFSQEQIREDNEVEIGVKISNLGPANATGFNIEIYIDDQFLDGKYVSILEPDKELYVTFNWTAVYGDHTVSVELVPDNYEMELTLTDNTATKSVNVGQKDVIDTNGDGNGDSDETDKSGTSDVFGWIMILVIVLVITIIFVLLFATRSPKRKPDYYVPSGEAPPPPPPVLPSEQYQAPPAFDQYQQPPAEQFPPAYPVEEEPPQLPEGEGEAEGVAEEVTEEDGAEDSGLPVGEDQDVLEETPGAEEVEESEQIDTDDISDEESGEITEENSGEETPGEEVEETDTDSPEEPVQ
jgi:hypothetical protein